MAFGLTRTGLFASLLLLAARAGADPAEAQAAPPAEAAPAGERPAKAPEVRRDPRGLKGISPFREALAHGDAALLRRDFDAALAAYRAALAQEPENALGHYRVGELQLLKGDLHEAESAFSAGLRVVVAKDPQLKAKLLFALADLAERQKAYDQARVKWAEYETLASAQQETRGLVASGTERKKVVETWQKLSADSTQVKARIEKGLQAADEAVRKNSK